jgi:hypothetical protein
MYYISKSNNTILFIMSNKDIVLLSVLNILFVKYIHFVYQISIFKVIR